MRTRLTSREALAIKCAVDHRASSSYVLALIGDHKVLSGFGQMNSSLARVQQFISTGHDQIAAQEVVKFLDLYDSAMRLPVIRKTPGITAAETSAAIDFLRRSHDLKARTSQP